MKRTALLLALLALSGCLTECGAVGHGVIGRGVVSDGAIGGGAVGGRPTASGCVLPGTPDYLFDADNIAQADATSVASWTNEGSVGGAATQGTGTAQPTLQKPCEGGGVLNGSACVDFDGGDFLATAAGTTLTQAVLIMVVHEVDVASGTNVAFDGVAVTKENAVVTTTVHRFYAGAYTNYGTVVAGNWNVSVVSADTTSSFARLNGSETSAASASNIEAINGVTLGAFQGGGNRMNGAVAFAVAYGDPESASVTAADLEAYAACRFGSFPQ